MLLHVDTIPVVQCGDQCSLGFSWIDDVGQQRERCTVEECPKLVVVSIQFQTPRDQLHNFLAGKH